MAARKTRFCVHGHDKDAVGRDHGGWCLACKRAMRPAMDRAYKSSPRGRAVQLAAARRQRAKPENRVKHAARNREWRRTPAGRAAEGRQNLRVELKRIRARIESKTLQIQQLEAQLGLTRTEVPTHG